MRSIQDNIRALSKESEARTSENGNIQKIVSQGFSRRSSVIPAVALTSQSKATPNNSKKAVEYKRGEIDWSKSGNIDLIGRFIIEESVTPEPSTLLLDLYPDAAAAYSLRKLRTDYEGSAIRVRRSSDNAEQDINFVDNELDTASLLLFVGANDGFVSVWYDQSGGGNNLIQLVATTQPYIVNGGELVLDGDKPSIYFNGTSELKSLNVESYGSLSRSIFISMNYKDSPSTRGIISLTNSGVVTGSLWIITPELAVRANTYVWITSDPIPFNNRSLLSNIYVSPNNLFEGNNLWLNSSEIVRTSGTDGSINTNSGSVTVGGNGLGSLRITANYDEIIIYKSNQTANRLAIESNINNYYTIY